MYPIYCNDEGFHIIYQGVDDSIVYDSIFNIKYSFNLDNADITENRYVALGYYNKVPFMVRGSRNYYKLIWLNCTPKEAYDKAVDAKVKQGTLISYLYWKHSITHPALLALEEIHFIKMDKSSDDTYNQILQHSMLVVKDYFETLTNTKHFRVGV